MSAAPHRRYNLLTGAWVLVSPQRLQRPWQGLSEAAAPETAKPHDETCHLCPGNLRAGGVRNPRYDGVFVFENDFPALSPHASARPSEPLLRSEVETGVCRVLCYDPRHDLALSQLGGARVRAVVDMWAEQFAELAGRDDTGAVTIFENRGAMMGASSPHPHGQVWATRSVPHELALEDNSQRGYLATHGEPLLAAYLARELEAKERIVSANAHFVALAPFWAVWPFETLVLPRRPAPDLAALDDAAREGLAALLSDLTGRYDRLFGAPFPYSMGWHQRPAAAHDASHFVVHAHFYPPLLRSATIRKHMVGFEMLAMPQRDMTCEEAAARLRAA